MASPCNEDCRCLLLGRKWVSVCYLDKFYTMHFPPNSIIFTKNHYQLVAQYSFLFAVRFQHVSARFIVNRQEVTYSDVPT